MATRVVEGKKPYTGGKAISIDEDKVISLNLRDENNLIIYDNGDDEIYVDLQLPDGITPTDAFPVGVTTGRAVVADGWDKAGTIICAKTTSGDNIKLLYADDGTLWIDNGTGTFKQIYFKADVDSLISTLTTYINTELAKKQNGVTSDTAPSNPSEGDLWYDTTNSAMKVWDGTQWNTTGGEIVYSTQAEYNALLPGALTDGKHYVIYTSDSPTPPSPWQPGANTVAYWKLDGNTTDSGPNHATLIGTPNFATSGSLTYGVFNDDIVYGALSTSTPITISSWLNLTNYDNSYMWYFAIGDTAYDRCYLGLNDGEKIMLLQDEQNKISTTSCPENQWFNLVFTTDGTTIYAYLDGNLIYTVAAGGSISGTQVYVGCRQEPSLFPAEGWKGYMSNLIIESKVWTSQEIQDYFNQTKGNYGIS